jgi:phosphoglycerate dehydrogenase-like enzyme
VKRILLLGFDKQQFSHTQMEMIRARAGDRKLLISRERAEIEAVLDDIEIVVGSFPRDLLVDAPNLRWFQQWGAGADWLMDRPEAKTLDFVLTNASGVHVVPISEHILALLLAFARRLPQAWKAQEERVWISNRWQTSFGTTIQGKPQFSRTMAEDDVFELADKTLLIVGAGAIGRRTARLAAAFDMRIIGIRRHPQRPAENIDLMAGPERLLQLLPLADFVVVSAPFTTTTRQMFDSVAFGAMKAGSYLINVGRGGIVDEQTLLQALEAGTIAGAGLDVFAEEPLPADSPLWRHPNLILTSHYSGLTPRYDERALAIFLANLERYNRGLTLHNIVDKAQGY